MKQPRPLKFPITQRSRQRGQAYAEYITVTAVVFVSAMWLFWGDSSVPQVISVAAAFKSLFSAYSFTLSLP